MARSASRSVATGPPRLAVVWCPQWPVVAAGGAPGEPVAVLHANRVVARSLAAAAAGVEVGQRRREAQGRCPQVRIVAHEPERDARAFRRVADAVATVVPRLELTEPGVLTFAARGPSRYFGGDEAMAERVLALVRGAVGDRLAAAGQPGVGIADGRFAAGVAAHRAGRSGKPLVVAPGTAADFLAPLPLGWLIRAGGIDPDKVGLFQRLGLRTLGELAALPVADVLARFGHRGVNALRMAAADDERPSGASDPPPGLEAVQEFDAPVHHLDVLVFSGKHLAEQLVGTLAADGRVCTQLCVTAETEHGERSERVWSRPTGLNVVAMVERIRWQLDGWAQGLGAAPPAVPSSPSGALDDATAAPALTGGVIQLRIEPVEVRSDDGQQLGLWGGRTQADDWAQRSVARLAGFVGEQHVVVPAWRGGRQPGDVYQWVPAVLSDLDDSARRLAPAADAGGPWPGRLPTPSPAVVHQDSTPVTVRDAAGHLVTVSGRGVISADPAVLQIDGTDRRITGWAGPWVMEERWWDGARHRRLARFQLTTESGQAYLAAIERQRWWLVAEYA